MKVGFSADTLIIKKTKKQINRDKLFYWFSEMVKMFVTTDKLVSDSAKLVTSNDEYSTFSSS